MGTKPEAWRHGREADTDVRVNIAIRIYPYLKNKVAHTLPFFD